MPTIDYSHFDHVGTSSEEETEIRGEGESRTEEGLLRTFVALRERRLDVERLAVDAHASCLLPSLERVALAYDDLSNRLLELDGASSESGLRSVGHRSEVVKTRLGAARALLALGDANNAALRADRAADAMCIPEGVDLPGAEAAIGESRASARVRGQDLVHPDAGQVFFCRAKARCQLQAWGDAKDDALLALTAARQRGDQILAAESEELALRCEFAMHGGGPGFNGEGACLPADEVDEAFKDLRIGPATSIVSRSSDMLDGSSEEGDTQMLEPFDINDLD